MSDKRYDNMPDDAHELAQDVPIPDSLSDGLACCDPLEWAESANAKELFGSSRRCANPGTPMSCAAKLRHLRHSGEARAIAHPRGRHSGSV